MRAVLGGGLAGALAAALVVGCSQPTPERRLVDAAVEAIGGRERLEAAATLVIEGEGEAYNLGQNVAPGTDLPVFQITDRRQAIDYANGRALVEQTRAAQFPTGLPPVVRQAMAVDGEFAFDVGPDGHARRVPGLAPGNRRADIYHTPVGLLRTAIDSTSRLTYARQEKGADAVDVTAARGETFTLFADETTRLPVRISSVGYHPNLGDVTVETELSGYREVDGLMLPHRIVTRMDRWVVRATDVTGYAINGEVGDLTAPEGVRMAAAAPLPPGVTVEEPAPGVWYLTGGSHHSVVVEFADHLVLFEAPQSEARALAVIDAARELRPGKPVTTLVLSHHHFDHSAGLRAAVSAGLTVVAQENNRALIEEVVRRPHTVVEDVLARHPAELQLETFGDELVMQDAERRVVLYHIAGSPHADTLTMAYLPRERMLVQADAFTPPPPDAPAPPPAPFAANLLENVRDRGLSVDWIVPLHGRIVPFGALVGAVQREMKLTE